jgi:hypothetical protein
VAHDVVDQLTKEKVNGSDETTASTGKFASASFMPIIKDVDTEHSS